MSQYRKRKPSESMEVEDIVEKSDVIRIDVLSLNGKNFDHKFSSEDIKDLWSRSFKRDKSEVIGQSSSKISKSVLRTPRPLILSMRKAQFSKTTHMIARLWVLVTLRRPKLVTL